MPKTWFVLLLIIGFPHNCIDICLVELEFILTILVLPLLLPRREAGLCRRVLCAVALRLWTVFFYCFLFMFCWQKHVTSWSVSWPPCVCRACTCDVASLTSSWQHASSLSSCFASTCCHNFR